MQTVELDATISAQGTIALPPGLAAFRGCRVHLTLVLDDATPGARRERRRAPPPEFAGKVRELGDVMSSQPLCGAAEA